MHWDGPFSFRCSNQDEVSEILKTSSVTDDNGDDCLTEWDIDLGVHHWKLPPQLILLDWTGNSSGDKNSYQGGFERKHDTMNEPMTRS